MKRKLIQFFLACFLVEGAIAQVNLEKFNNNGNVGQVFANLRKKQDVSNDLPTVGSPYINEDFMPCSISWESEKIGNFYYRHNAYNDEIEIKDANLEEAPVSSLTTNKAIGVTDVISGDEILLRTYRDKKENVRNGYMYRLAEGANYTLFSKRQVRFKPGTRAMNSLTRSTPNRFTQDVDLFLKGSDDEVADFLKGGKNQLVSLLKEEHRQPALDFIKQENLKIRKQSDLVKLIDYLNAL